MNSTVLNTIFTPAEIKQAYVYLVILCKHLKISSYIYIYIFYVVTGSLHTPSLNIFDLNVGEGQTLHFEIVTPKMMCLR